LSKGRVEDLNLVGRVVGVGVTGTQQPSERLPVPATPSSLAWSTNAIIG
jgi:hypothetical protein